jgi:CRP-like cAMP-binding protein
MNRLHANHAFHGLNGLHGLSAIHAASRSAGGTHPGTRTTEHLPTRQFLHAGDEIDALRVLAVPHVLLSGVAISRRLIDAPEELQLLQPGDLVGLETFQLRAGERRIQALIDCELAPLRRMSDAEWRELLLHALLRRESRPGLASLRVGPVSERVRRLLLLLSGAGLSERDVLELPPLASIAAVTASTNETVCRVVSHFRRSGLIEDAGSRKVRLTAGLQLSAGELPAGLTRSKSRVRD